MEQVRNRRLDNLCEAIGDHRDAKNKATQDEQADIQAALQEMQRSGITTYRHAKIELARVPGAEKLRVRLTKEEGDAGDGDLEAGDGESSDQGEFAQERARDLEEIDEIDRQDQD